MKKMMGAVTRMICAAWAVATASNPGATRTETQGDSAMMTTDKSPVRKRPTRNRPAAIRQAAAWPSLSTACT